MLAHCLDAKPTSPTAPDMHKRVNLLCTAATKPVAAQRKSQKLAAAYLSASLLQLEVSALLQAVSALVQEKDTLLVCLMKCTCSWWCAHRQ